MALTPHQLRDKVNAAYPGRNWDQQCQRFVWNAIWLTTGREPAITYASAKTARLASRIVSTDPNAAPPGAIHYWIIGQYDHNGVALGNGLVAYATNLGDTVEKWGTALKVSHVTTYPAPYAGWAYQNGSNAKVLVTEMGGAVDWTGGGSVAAWLNIQTWLQKNHGYTGAIDGAPRGLTWMSLQGYLKSKWGYTGVVDGVPGVLSWQAVQRWLAADAGYTGVIDGDPGSLTAAALERLADNLVAVVKPTQPNQRVVGAVEVRRRSAPALTATSLDPQIQPGTVVTLNGFKRAEAVEGNDVWFQNFDGSWSWSGGFTDKSVVGLKDLGVPVFTKVTRTAGTVEVRRRDKPSTAGTSLDPLIAAGAVTTVKGWAHGQTVEGNSVWFLLEDNSWAWSGGFTSTSTVGLVQQIVEVPAEGSVLDPAAPWKSQPVDSALAKWIGSPNYNFRTPSPVKDHITFHWMAGTLAGTDAQFQKPGTIVSGRGTNPSTTYGVGLTEIHQYVKEKDYAHGDGDAQSNASGISIEHEGGYKLADGSLKVPDKRVLDLSAKLCADIAKRRNLGKLELGKNAFLHKDFVSTTCPGTLDVAYIISEANRINGHDLPDPEVPETPSLPELTDAIERLTGLEANVARIVTKLAQAGDVLSD